jgi:hypothetical protein
MQAPMQSDRKVKPDLVEYRTMTLSEVRALKSGDRVRLILNNGRIGEAKINGAIKVWKSDPSRIEVPIKYGLYEYTHFDSSEATQRLVVLLSDSEGLL